MDKINILQVGVGPLGVKIAHYISERPKLKVLAAVDKDPRLIGQDLGLLTQGTPSNVIVAGSLEEVEEMEEIDVAILSTVSDIERVSQQLIEILDYGLPVVSTCEELAYPWFRGSDWVQRIHEKALQKKVAIVATGVNPGFMMDALPTMMTGVCQGVEHVEVSRVQDAQYRRLPFQQKIGAGLELEEFESKKQTGALRHIGLTESMHFIAHSLQWKIDRTEEAIVPVVAETTINTKEMTIRKGQAMGVRQIGQAWIGQEEKIKLVFEAAVGSNRSYDEITITGRPVIHSKIEGGVNGDIATSAIVLNAIPQILKSSPGLKTMADLGLVSYW